VTECHTAVASSAAGTGLGACHDPSSIRRAEALGVGPGWHCLDAGAGCGSFARWLSARAGPTGRVVAADLDVSLLDSPGLEVRRLDLETDELPKGAYDFVHTRLVLLHVPARNRMLAKHAAALRPGGVLMVEEDDIHPVLATAEPAQFWSLTWLQARERIEAMGVDGEVVDAGRAVLDDPGRWFHGPVKVIAWVRRPA
jgi:ubiquinone/menaquinone biosynthesis C-methylase UbiE